MKIDGPSITFFNINTISMNKLLSDYFYWFIIISSLQELETICLLKGIRYLKIKASLCEQFGEIYTYLRPQNVNFFKIQEIIEKIRTNVDRVLMVLILKEKKILID